MHAHDPLFAAHLRISSKILEETRNGITVVERSDDPHLIK